MSMKYYVLLISLCFFLTDGKLFAENIVVTEAYVKENYNKREVMIQMRDGVKLFTCIYEPKNMSLKSPILLNRTCYGVTPYGADKFMRLHSPTWSEYVRNGYILVFQDVRGKNKSEGVFEDLRPFIVDKMKKSDLDEASDTYDTAEWLLKNTNTNGNIGVFGISYPGFYSTMAALSAHPAIKAVSPQAPVTEWFRGDDAHYNGALFYYDMFSFGYWFEYLNVADYYEGKISGEKAVNPADIVRNDGYTDFLSMGSIPNFTRILGDSCTMWNNIVAHPDLDEWWERRNVSYYCQNIKPAVMVVGGLFDAENCYGAFITYKAMKRQSPDAEIYLVEGPWSHGSWSRGGKIYMGDIYFGDSVSVGYYIKNIEYPFFAYYLEGKGEKPSAEVRVFHTGENAWKEYLNGWPAVDKLTPFYLNSKGTISAEPEYASVPTKYVSDPSRPVPFMEGQLKSRPIEYMLADQRFASTRPDVAVFTTPVLESPLSLAGEIVAELEVSIDATDADFVVKLIDVFPDGYEYPDSVKRKMPRTNVPMGGYQMLVRGEVMRGKYRNSLAIDSVAFNTTESKKIKKHNFSFIPPQPFVPNEPTKVKFRLTDVAHTFMPGHRMMIQIQSTWVPLVDRNPQTFCNIYECADDDYRPCTVTIHHSEEHPSRIWLPVKK